MENFGFNFGTAVFALLVCLLNGSVCAAEDPEFKGRRIVLLGATQGMGRAAGELMVERGAQVVFLSRSQAKIDKLLNDMGNPENAFGFTCDAAKIQDIDKALQKSNELMGGIDGFMYGPTCTNPVGFLPLKELWDSDKFKEAHECQQFFNVVSFVESVRLVVPYIKESGGGSILSISSVASHIPSISMAVYGAAKATADFYVRSLSLTLAKDNIRINSFAAGPHRTSAFDMWGDQGKAFLEDLTWRVPMGRAGTAEEGGESIAFMLSNRASFMTGEVLVSDGGLVNVKGLSDVGVQEESRIFQPSPAIREFCNMDK